MCVMHYAKGVFLVIEKLRMHHILPYKSDRDGKNYLRIVEDEVVELLTEEQHRSRISSYIDYIDNCVGVSLLRRNISF